MTALATDDEIQIRSLHKTLLQAWNERDARAFARCFTSECICIGFDGTAHTTSVEIEKALQAIFEGHDTASYVSKIRDVRRVDAATVLLRAVAGMVPSGVSIVKADRNAVQVLVASFTAGAWRIVSFQNTPAAYDGRTDESDRLTAELQELLPSRDDSRAA
jgi:uncharacterized protein (TIGR02246 family)